MPQALQQKKRSAITEFSQRTQCLKCRRPESYCYCEDLNPQDSFHRIIVLIHPQEARHPIASGRMTHLSLKNSMLIKGLDFSLNAVWQEFIKVHHEDTFLLYPDKNGLNLSDFESRKKIDLKSRPLNFILIDSKWRMAKRMIESCPYLSSLKKISFTPDMPSQFLVRTQPSSSYLSTIEATCELLKVIEPSFSCEKQTKLLRPFHQMVARQLEFTPEKHLENRLSGRPRLKKELSHVI